MLKTATCLSLTTIALLIPGCMSSEEVQSIATSNMTAFAVNSGLYQAVSCVGMDSDSDGYVSCTVIDLQTRQPITLDCSYRTDGCKIQAPYKGVNSAY